MIEQIDFFQMLYTPLPIPLLTDITDWQVRFKSINTQQKVQSFRNSFVLTKIAVDSTTVESTPSTVVEGVDSTTVARTIIAAGKQGFLSEKCPHTLIEE